MQVFIRAMIFLSPVLLEAQDTARIQELIRNLDDDSFEIRTEAERELAAIGAAAIPHLKSAIAEAEGQKEKTELRIRATSALRAIEFAEKAKHYYVEPALVTLDARDAELGQILSQLEKQTGVRMQAGPLNPKAKITLNAEKAPLFRVLDDLCRGGEDRSYEYRDDGVRFSRAPFVRCPSAYEGPFRFRIVRLRHEHSTDFKASEGQVELAVEADWQKSLKPSRRVDLLIGSATDDKGATLEASKIESADGENGVVLAPNGRMVFRLGGNQGEVEGSNMLAVQAFTLKGLRSGATRISLRGQARFIFPLEKTELAFIKPASAEPLQQDGLSFSLKNRGASHFWRLTVTRVEGGASANPEDIDGCIDRESFVALDDAGKEYPATLHPSDAADRNLLLRGGEVPAGTPLAVYQVAFPTLENRAAKTIRFKYLSQVFVKTVPLIFDDVPLP